MRSDDPEAQATAHQLVHCVLDADSDGLTETLETVVDHPGDELRPYVREVVAELINVATAAVRSSAGRLYGNAAFAVDLRDDANDKVGIDELDPPVRATIRAMLAELNGSPDDALFQLDLAVRGVDRRTGLDTVRRALTMTIGLLHWSEQSDPLEALMDPDPTADEADLLEQHLNAVPDDDPLVTGDAIEADPTDVHEQHQQIPGDDDEDRR
ncbi:hypothetical protein [Actinophytocola oryzae]|uniref:Uncharacterized protein n=1 Tax=Actinophytocola oryzae TaxID=502181 RepID=A0A4R7W6D3_9PSEU|nr:hypothetical protein [Actinophytocola oryzae]TDV57237.1 hypothetical protein CLV71_101108 [Actinophytocola oryzae]